MSDQPPELIQDWLLRARSSLKLGKAGLRTQGVLPEDVCFHAQQCAEKALKGMLTHLSIQHPRTHALEEIAAPGLAAMIRASASGDAQALQLLANMAEQMSGAGGDMAKLAAIMRRLVNGERDADQLVAGMGPLGRELLISLLDELAKLRPQ